MAHGLLVVFLRGGADGLWLVPPHSDPALADARPTLALARPDDRRAAADRRVVDVDGRFGLHPLLSPLLPLIQQGELCVVHAVGSDDETRSHFEAQDRMERAGLSAASSASGWIARHLATRSGAQAGPLSAVAFGSIAPESLRGQAASVMPSLAEANASAISAGSLARIERLYQASQGRGLVHDRELYAAGRDAIQVSRELSRVAAASEAEIEHAFPKSSFGEQLREAAILLRHRDRLGVEVVTVDQGGWDSHFVQAEAIASQVTELGQGLAALRAALGDALEHVTVLVMTEFGRRTYENVSLGTDHGRASVALVMSGRLEARGVVGPFQTLGTEDVSDLSVRVDFRSLLSETLAGPLGNARAGEVFPGWGRNGELGLFA